MKLLSLFSGIGAFEKALTNIGADYELVGFSEIDKWAVQSYCAIHGVDGGLNLGDISEINTGKLPNNIDLITHGSPCQDFSNAGLMKGGDKGSNTRSSLMWETVRIIGEVKPKYVIWENVKGVLYKNNIHNFELYLNSLEKLGYNNYYKVLNAKDYGIPQNRERVFVVSIRKDVDGGRFAFPKPQKAAVCLNDILDNERVHLDTPYINKNVKRLKENYPVTFPTPLRFTRTKYGKAIRRAYESGQVKEKIGNMRELTPRNDRLINTLTSVDKDNYIWDNAGISTLTTYEKFLLMGFSYHDFNKVVEVVPKTSLNIILANSIVVPVVEAIFTNLLLKESV